jgi:hypothetical protein
VVGEFECKILPLKYEKRIIHTQRETFSLSEYTVMSPLNKSGEETPAQTERTVIAQLEKLPPSCKSALEVIAQNESAIKKWLSSKGVSGDEIERALPLFARNLDGKWGYVMNGSEKARDENGNLIPIPIKYFLIFPVKKNLANNYILEIVKNRKEENATLYCSRIYINFEEIIEKYKTVWENSGYTVIYDDLEIKFIRADGKPEIRFFYEQNNTSCYRDIRNREWRINVREIGNDILYNDISSAITDFLNYCESKS